MISKPAEQGAPLSESERLDTLFEIGQSLTGTLSPDTAFRGVLEILARRLGTPRGLVCLIDPKSEETPIYASVGYDTSRGTAPDSLSEGAVGRVIRTRQPIVVPRVSSEPRFPNAASSQKTTQQAVLSHICVPILVDHSPVGALGVDVVHSKERDYGADLGCLEVAATMLAQTIRADRILDGTRRRVTDAASRQFEVLGEHGSSPPTIGYPPEGSDNPRGPSFHDAVEAFERNLLLDALKTTGGNRARAARLLGTTPRILNYKVQKYQINYRDLSG